LLNIIYNIYMNIIFHDSKRQVRGNFQQGAVR
jgi:hypothetical protein